MIHLILPAYNEEKAIGKLIERVSNLNKKSSTGISVLVVNDGSTDNTVSSLDCFKKKISIEIISREKNGGLGQALKTGILYLLPKLNNDDILITMDADNTHDPFLIPLMLDKISEGYEVIIASRFKSGSKEIGVPFTRRFFSKSAKFIFTFLFPISDVKDYTSGYRAFKVSFLKKAVEKYQNSLIKEKGVVCMVELLLKLRVLDAKMTPLDMI